MNALLKAKKNISNIELYNAFILWFNENIKNQTLPTNRLFLKNIKKYKNILKAVWTNNATSSGIKKLGLIDKYKN